MSEQEYTNDAEHIAHLTKRIRDAEQMAETYRKMAGDAMKVVERQREVLVKFGWHDVTCQHMKADGITMQINVPCSCSTQEPPQELPF